MSMKYIRERYNVPAKKGMHVIAQGRDGVIVGSKSHYLRIKVEGEKNILSFHPTWDMEYITKTCEIWRCSKCNATWSGMLTNYGCPNCRADIKQINRMKHDGKILYV